jgi:hypothetical protein
LRKVEGGLDLEPIEFIGLDSYGAKGGFVQPGLGDENNRSRLRIKGFGFPEGLGEIGDVASVRSMSDLHGLEEIGVILYESDREWQPFHIVTGG